MKSFWPLLFGVCLLTSATLSAAGNSPFLSFEASAVVGSGFTPRKQVVLFGEANPPQPFTRRLVNYLQVLTADQQGNFRWEAPEPIPQNSVWFAIGSVPADQAVAVPWSAIPPKALLAPPRLLVGRDAGDDALSISDYMVDVLVIRPDDSVWLATSIRHGAADLNRGLPGKAVFSTKTLKGAGSPKTPASAPARLTPADTVVIVHPVSLHFYIGQLPVN